MRGIVLFICGFMVLMASVASAATRQCGAPNPVNYRGSKLVIGWGDMVEPFPDGIRIKVGTSPGSYSVVKDFKLADGQKIPLDQLLPPGKGTYYAVAVPLLGTQEIGEVSKECPFGLSLLLPVLTLETP